MRIDDRILLNQLAQGIVDSQEGDRWFLSLDARQKTAALREVNFMIANTSPRKEDVPAAIERSGLRSTFTPCVLLQKGGVRVQIAKIANLPEAESLKSFRLLVALLGVCDSRRRTERPIDLRNHWWHRDLSNPEVVTAIKKEFGT